MTGWLLKSHVPKPVPSLRKEGWHSVRHERNDGVVHQPIFSVYLIKKCPNYTIFQS